MTTITLNLNPEIEEKISRILNANKENENFFNEVIDFRINRIQTEIINIKADLADLEKKYDISSELFYEKYKKGEMGDNNDTLLWAGLYEMLMECKKDLKDLE